METMRNDVQTEDLFENMSVELCKLLKKNLFKIFNPIMDEKNKTDEILLNFPFSTQAKHDFFPSSKPFNI